MKKPGKYPDWLYDASQAGVNVGLVLWLCSGCGGPYWRPPDAPLLRLSGPCWRSHSYGVKCVTPKGERILYPASQKPSPAQSQDEIPVDGWDHGVCVKHIKHPSFAKRICLLSGQEETDVLAFADEMAALSSSRVPAY